MYVYSAILLCPLNVHSVTCPLYLNKVAGAGAGEEEFRCLSSEQGGVFLFFLVTAQSFIQQTKDSIPWRHEGGPIPKERPQSILGLSFCTFCLLSLCKLGLGVFHLRFSLPLQAADFLLFCYCGLFPLSFSHHHFGLLFAFLPNTSLFF